MGFFLENKKIIFFLFFCLFLGTYSRDKRTTDDHEIVVPKKVTNNGIHISNELNHHHDNNDDIKLHYQLTISGLQYHLELTPSTNFLSPGMLIERRKRNLHTRNSGHDHYSSKCHYRGFIRGHVNSIVALSACNGLVSYYNLSFKNSK